MLKLEQSLVAAFAGVLALVALASPALAQGQRPLDVDVVNNPTVQASALYPARPFQVFLIPRETEPVGLEACTTLPADAGLTVELVTVRTNSFDSSGYLIMALRTTAGGVTVNHAIPTQRLVISSNFISLTVTQPLRVYADPGTEVCLRANEFAGGPYPSIQTSISGQLGRVAPLPQ